MNSAKVRATFALRRGMAGRSLAELYKIEYPLKRPGKLSTSFQKASTVKTRTGCRGFDTARQAAALKEKHCNSDRTAPVHPIPGESKLRTKTRTIRHLSNPTGPWGRAFIG